MPLFGPALGPFFRQKNPVELPPTQVWEEAEEEEVEPEAEGAEPELRVGEAAGVLM